MKNCKSVGNDGFNKDFSEASWDHLKVDYTSSVR